MNQLSRFDLIVALCLYRSAYCSWLFLVRTNRMLKIVTFVVVQDECLSGGHGLMVQGYEPVIRTIAKDIDIRLNHR